MDTLEIHSKKSNSIYTVSGRKERTFLTVTGEACYKAKVQKEIEAACKRHNKPYIVVTQMLASMEHSPVPTRAEVSDIFNAVLDGCTGVMVTGETAVGDYPAEVIRYLTNTVKSAEDYLQH